MYLFSRPFVIKQEITQKRTGGEGGIRTLDTLLTYTPLAGERLQPLGHFTYSYNIASCKTIKIVDQTAEEAKKRLVSRRIGTLIRFNDIYFLHGKTKTIMPPHKQGGIISY